MLFWSDDLVEVHNGRQEMFGFEPVRALLAAHWHTALGDLIEVLLGALAAFTAEAPDQEEYTTMVVLQRAGGDAGVPDLGISGDCAGVLWNHDTHPEAPSLRQ